MVRAWANFSVERLMAAGGTRLHARTLGVRMRLLLSLLGAALALGCNSTSSPVDETARVTGSLQRRVTPEEARQIFLKDLDDLVALTKTNPPADGNRQLITGIHEDSESELKAFLSRFGPADELWLYKAPGTLKRRGTETGFARVSLGKVVDHMVARIDP
jgi:hypothetical protein